MHTGQAEKCCIPDHGRNRIYDLYTASLMLHQLSRVHVRFVCPCMLYFGTESSAFDISAISLLCILALYTQVKMMFDVCGVTLTC